MGAEKAPLQESSHRTAKFERKILLVGLEITTLFVPDCKE
jgi:hypothetical protein